MNKPATRHPIQSLLPDVSDFFAGFPALGSMRPSSNLIRIEDELTDDKYVVRAELPGIDPKKDVEVTVRDGMLTLKAERTVEEKSDTRSEFTYGSFIRSMPLPNGFEEDKVKADYDKGILTVTVPLSESKSQGKQITVETK